MPGTWPTDPTGGAGSGSGGGGPSRRGAAPPARPGEFADAPDAGPDPRAGLDAPSTLDGARPRTSGWRRLLGLRVTVILIGIVLVITYLATRGHSAGPSLATSCTTPALAVEPTSVARHALVRFKVTGPSDQVYALAVDAAGIRRNPDGTYTALPPSPGVPVQAASRPGRLKNCAASGAFRVLVPAGPHTLRVFRLSGDRAEQVASRPLRVTGD
jgi:hypothetical protein